MDVHMTREPEEHRTGADPESGDGARVDLTRHEGVAVVTFENGPLNLLTMKLRAGLQVAADQIRGNDSIRAVVLVGAGSRAFSAGSDIREFPTTGMAGRARAVQEHRCYDAIATLPQPVIALLSGHVLGGGLELAMAADFRVAEEGTQLALPEVKLGAFPSGGGTQRLPRVIPPAAAKKLMFLGESIDASAGLRLGLVDEVTQTGNGKQAALALARDLASKPPLAVQAIKRAVDHGLQFGVEAGERLEEELIANIFGSQDCKEGVRAFLESREPRFAGE